jgi:hypothetical protein
MSVSHPDKGTLPLSEVQRRVAQFAGGTSSTPAVGAPYAVALTRAALFTQKARLFPGCAFVVGVDTARRILDPKVVLTILFVQCFTLNAVDCVLKYFNSVAAVVAKL